MNGHETQSCAASSETLRQTAKSRLIRDSAIRRRLTLPVQVSRIDKA